MPVEIPHYHYSQEISYISATVTTDLKYAYVVQYTRYVDLPKVYDRAQQYYMHTFTFKYALSV